MVFMPVFWGCQEEEVAAGYEIPEVKKVADFVDSDGKVYRCIEVGDLIWMADNLAKRLPLGGREVLLIMKRYWIVSIIRL